MSSHTSHYLLSIDDLLWNENSTQLDRNEDLEPQVDSVCLDSRDDSSAILDDGVLPESDKPFDEVALTPARPRGARLRFDAPNKKIFRDLRTYCV